MNHAMCLIRVFAGKDEDEVFGVAALALEPARTKRAGPSDRAQAKAVNRFALPRTPRRWRVGRGAPFNRQVLDCGDEVLIFTGEKLD